MYQRLGPRSATGALAERRFAEAETVKAVVASRRRLHWLPYGGRSTPPPAAPTPSAVLPAPATFTALVAVPTRGGTRVFAGTSIGTVLLFDGRGECLTTTRVADRGVISLAAAELDGLALVFAACADATVRVLDSNGQLRYGFGTPGAVRALDVQRRRRGALWLLGGVRDDTRVYVWDPIEVLPRDDASSTFTLVGGSTPAYGGCLIDTGGDHAWAAHGGWDGRACLYELPDAHGGSRRPVRVLQAWAARDRRDPLYAIVTTTVAGRAFLFAGGESGVVHGWALDDSRGSRPQLALCGPRSAVKSLRAVVLGLDAAPVLLAGARDGSTWQLAPAEPDASRRCVELPPQEAGLDLFEERSW
jgi:hypothetical protein